MVPAPGGPPVPAGGPLAYARPAYTAEGAYQPAAIVQTVGPDGTAVPTPITSQRVSWTRFVPPAPAHPASPHLLPARPHRSPRRAAAKRTT